VLLFLQFPAVEVVVPPTPREGEDEIDFAAVPPTPREGDELIDLIMIPAPREGEDVLATVGNVLALRAGLPGGVVVAVGDLGWVGGVVTASGGGRG